MGKTPAFVMRGERLGHFLSALPPYPALRVRYGGSALMCSGLKPLRPLITPRGPGLGSRRCMGPLPRFKRQEPSPRPRPVWKVRLFWGPYPKAPKPSSRVRESGRPRIWPDCGAPSPKGAPGRVAIRPMPGRSFLSATAYHCSFLGFGVWWLF